MDYKIMYKKWSENGVADALSRLSPESSAECACHVVVPSQPKWLEDVVASYSENSHAKELLSKLAVNKDSVPGFSLVNGLLRYKNRIWVGCDIELQQQLLKAFTLHLLWDIQECLQHIRNWSSCLPGKWLKSVARSFVQSCRICQQAKPDRGKS
jgi:hypothetical protein